MADSCSAEIRCFQDKYLSNKGNTLVLVTSDFQGVTIRPIVPRQKHFIVFTLFAMQPFFLGGGREGCSSKIISELFSTFLDDTPGGQMSHLKKKTDNNRLNTTSIVYFL